jgi:hypothetical protein
MTPQGCLAVESTTAAPSAIASGTPLTFERGVLGFPDNRGFVLAATSREGL